jgi:CheY-like chemotaxis protein
MSGNDEDDKATVVLDINALKEELATKSAAGGDAIQQDVEFVISPGDEVAPEPSSGAEESLSSDDDLGDDLGDDLIEEVEEKRQVVLFDFNSEYFTKLSAKLPDTFDYNIVKELKDLNKILQSKEPVVIMFNYHAAPKAVNQLTTQIKAKFPEAKTVIIAKGLSPEKAQQHQNSKAGANAYLSVPFNIQKFEETIQNV